jgi:hypothetical protein
VETLPKVACGRSGRWDDATASSNIFSQISGGNGFKLWKELVVDGSMLW